MKTILVVDDEPKIVTLARDYLEHAGFAVLTTGDGRDALATVRQRRPDLVVLDLGLPGLDGLDVTRELRRDSSVPIVMLTARDDEFDKLLGLELGADDYLTKPFSPRELVARVRRPPTCGRAAAGRSCRRVVPRPATDAAEVAGAVDLADRVRARSRRWPAPRRIFTAHSSRRSTGSPSTPTSGHDSHIRTCAARSSPTRAGRATS
jgi:DNA-binding response OmpR family regulator